MDIGGVLSEAQRRGFVGPGPLEPHIAQAQAFAAAVGTAPLRALDLGSGGGLPGLVLAELWPASRWTLLESQHRRGDHLRWAVNELGLGDRVVVDQRRAEDAGRDPALRATVDLVVSRSFGPPAVVAECASPFLVAGGLLVVSEPPDDPDRWPADGLEPLGLVPDREQAPGFKRLRQVEPSPGAVSAPGRHAHQTPALLTLPTRRRTYRRAMFHVKHAVWSAGRGMSPVSRETRPVILDLLQATMKDGPSDRGAP